MEFPNQTDHAGNTEPVPALPTMGDLDRLAADLDQVDATLAALDRDVVGNDVASGLADQPA